MKRSAVASGVAVLLVALAGFGLAAATRPLQAAAGDREWSFVGTVLEVTAGGDRSEAVVPIGLDPRFRLRLEIREWRGESGPWAAGSVVVFSIHSPALLFGGLERDHDAAPWAGRTYLFRLSGATAAGRTVVQELAVEAPIKDADLAPPTVPLGHVPALGEELPIAVPTRVRILTAPSRMLPSYVVEQAGIRYTVAVDDHGRVEYVAVADPRFRCPEGIGVGSTLQATLAVATHPEARKEPGWAFIVELPSGWNAAFPLGTRASSPIPPGATVLWLFRRQ